MNDEIGLVLQEALPGAGDRLEMQVEARPRKGIEEAPQQAQGLAQRTKVADHHAELALLAVGEMLSMLAERGHVVEQQVRPRMESAAGGAQRHAVAVAIEERESQLALEVLDRGEDRWV